MIALDPDRAIDAIQRDVYRRVARWLGEFGERGPIFVERIAIGREIAEEGEREAQRPCPPHGSEPALLERLFERDQRLAAQMVDRESHGPHADCSEQKANFVKACSLSTVAPRAGSSRARGSAILIATTKSFESRRV